MLDSVSAKAEDFSLTKQPSVSPNTSINQQSVQKIETTPVLSDSINSDESEETTPMEQVTSVSQLTDVQPNDWAFEALQSLVERYGCVEGFPNRTYQGNRSLTRYEFAAGLNKCLAQISKLIATNSPSVRKEDLIKLQKLQENFATELASLSNRIDVLAAKQSRMESHGFSTTTKLNGITITYLADAFGKNAGPANSGVLSYQTYLTLATSFTGKDSLTVGLESGNITKLTTATKFPQGRLSGTTDETTLVFPNLFSDQVLGLTQLEYSFPIGDKLQVVVDAFSSTRSFKAPLTPLNNLATGALSNYGIVNPLFYPIAQYTGLALDWQIAPWMDIGFSFGSELSGNDPTQGLFKGGYVAAIEPAINLGRLRLSASYINTYSPQFGIDTGAGSNAAKVVGAGPVVANTYLMGESLELLLLSS